MPPERALLAGDGAMEPVVGFEPTTCRLQGGCSGLLSYTGMAVIG
jgi:hypothetical protein